MTLAIPAQGARPRRLWVLIGLSLMAYCVLGNWLVLPGYRRHLAHLGDGEAVSQLALIWGAARTILWMLSFHLGALCLAWAALAANGDGARAFRRWFLLGAVVWIGLWAIPALPGPYTAFFAGVGVFIMLMILVAFGRAGLTGEPFADAPGRPLADRQRLLLRPGDLGHLRPGQRRRHPASRRRDPAGQPGAGRRPDHQADHRTGRRLGLAGHCRPARPDGPLTYSRLPRPLVTSL